MVTDKIIKDGKVAILISPGYGGGWSTWNRDYCPAAIFCPALVEAVELGRPISEIETLAAQLFPGCYTGGCEDLIVKWLQVGDKFRINEYDGSESLELIGSGSWDIA